MIDGIYDVKISGMTCERCAANVRERLIRPGHPRTEDVVVNFSEGQARLILSDYQPVSFFHSALEDSRYEVTDVVFEGSLNIPVLGMHCNNCVKKVAEILAGIDGVLSSSVSLEEESAQVTGHFSLMKLENVLRGAGYSTGDREAKHIKESPEPVVSTGAGENAVDQRTRKNNDELSETRYRSEFLAIEGMTCASCVSAVEKALSQVRGVNKASVNFGDETAWVETSSDVEALIKAVINAGYNARVLAREEAAVDENRLRQRLVTAIWKSAVAITGGLILMVGHQFELFPEFDNKVFWLLTGLLCAVIMWVSGGNFFISAWRSARQFKSTMDTLIALGTGVAWTFSMLVVSKPSLVPVPYVYFEAALFIIGLVNLGKALENNAKNRTAAAIRSLLAVQPSTALQVTDGGEREVPVDSIQKGDLIRIKPGETVPIDGQIIEGESSLDESMLTGEPELVEKSTGAFVSAGTINQFGSFIMTAQRVGAETNLARIVEAVKRAQSTKPEIGRLVDKISAWFVPMVILTAIVTALIWGYFGPEPVLQYMLVTSVSVLIIACPCALGLATPLSIMIAMGKSASLGVLVRNGDSLQLASQVTTLIFDKTGTLTLGKPVVLRHEGDNRMLDLALSLESLSEHPLAGGIVEYCNNKGASKLAVGNFEISPGGGLGGFIDNRRVLVGNKKFVEASGVHLDNRREENAETRIYVVEGNTLSGVFSLQDAIRPEAKTVMAELAHMGIRTIMLTGDNSSTAERVARELGIEEYFAEVQPLEKRDKVEALRESGEVIGMVGDGINDSVALSTADVGFAMSGGSDIAVENADIALVGNRLESVIKAITLSKMTMRNIRQNLFAAFVYNICLIPVAAGILFPLNGVLISPIFAGAAMALSSISVVLNAGRLRSLKV